MNYQQIDQSYMGADCKMDSPVKPRDLTPCESALSGIESETKRLHATIQVLRERLGSVLRQEPESQTAGDPRECGQSPIHDRLLRQKDEIDAATRLLTRLESLLTV